MKLYGGVKIQLLAFLASALDEGEKEYIKRFKCRISMQQRLKSGSTEALQNMSYRGSKVDILPHVIYL
jgi:hypothetical protein